jgi:lysophospholipase
MSLAEDARRTALARNLVACAAAELPPCGEAIFFETRDGARLRVAQWERSGARASVIVMPGRTEFIEKYGEVVGELLGRGFAVGVIDWRGQGLSSRLMADPLRGHIDDFSTHVRDFAEIALGPFAALPRPWLILAHSMGANIAANIVLKMPDIAACAVLTAPMFALRTGPLPLPVARLVAACALVGLAGRYVPGGKPLSVLEEKFEENVVTHDARRHARARAIVEAEPRLALASPTLGFVNAALAACDRIAAPGGAEGLTLPVLAVLAGEEALVDNSRAKAILARMRNAQILEIPGARHEILMETDAVRLKFWVAFDAFAREAILAGAQPALRGTA